jgi:20S proteasome subunit beta 4
VEATANFLRSEIDGSFRRRGGPFMVNCLLGGYDTVEQSAKLYWIDYVGTLQQVTKGAHGYAGYFVNSVLDNNWRQGMSLDEGLDAVKKCILELKTRFIINQPNFVAKIVTKDGVQVMPLSL